MNSLRILYTFGYFLDASGGHAIHALKLCHAFKRAGHNVRLLGPFRRTPKRHRERTFPEWVIPVESEAVRIPLALSFRKAVAQQILNWKPDLLYVRPALKDAFAIYWVTSKDIPFFVEINTLTYHEQVRMGHPLRAAISGLIEMWEIKHSQGVICMTEEIASRIQSKTKGNIAVCTTGNGFDPEDIGLAKFDPAARRYLKTPDQAKVLVFAGSLQPWAGLDLLIPVLKEFKDVYLWIIGKGPDSNRLRKLADQSGVGSRLRWLKWIRSEMLYSFFAAADIGVGPLALKRKQMKEAQPLKVRSYLGAGLPVLIGYKDTRLSQELRWVKRVDASSPYDLQQSIEELLALPTRRVSFRRQIREFAISVLSWDRIAAETVSFIRKHTE